MTEELERAFHLAMLRTIDELRNQAGYNPTRFAEMVATHGGREAVKRLLQGATASDGFTRLWELKRLDLSAEAHVIMPTYASLFTDDERATAQRRLEDHGFDATRSDHAPTSPE